MGLSPAVLLIGKQLRLHLSLLFLDIASRVLARNKIRKIDKILIQGRTLEEGELVCFGISHTPDQVDDKEG